MVKFHNLIFIYLGPHIVLHGKSPISVIHETPAHIGNRHETKTITSLNIGTGKPESHVINRTVPIYGQIEQVKTAFKNDVRSYDLTTKSFGNISSSISAS